MTHGYSQDYFAHRDLEVKDWTMAMQWLDFLEPKTVFSYGDGIGKQTFMWNYFGITAEGWDPFTTRTIVPLLSEVPQDKQYGLTLCIDVMEHVKPEETDAVIEALIRLTKIGGHLLLSICDESLWRVYVDETHCNKHTKAWWTHQFLKRGLEQIPIPSDWLYRNQLYLFRRVK